MDPPTIALHDSVRAENRMLFLKMRRWHHQQWDFLASKTLLHLRLMLHRQSSRNLTRMRLKVKNVVHGWVHRARHAPGNRNRITQVIGAGCFRSLHKTRDFGINNES